MAVKTLDTVEHELQEIVEAVEAAANYGMAHRDQPSDVERALGDCEEMLRHVMGAAILEG